MNRYLFRTTSTFNNKLPFYEINPLPDSDIIKAYLFSGKGFSSVNNMGIVYIYLELSTPLTDENQYFNLQRILNLISLETDQYTDARPIQIGESEDFNAIFTKFSSAEFYKEKTNYHGLAREPNHILRVQHMINLIGKLKRSNYIKFDNSLNTLAWALEIRQLPNPHRRFTLYMTLILSSIEQLSEKPRNCTYHDLCPDCKKEIYHHRKDEGTQQMLENLVKGLLTGNGVEDGVIRVKLLYRKLRSAFLHSGVLYGKEQTGGFLGKIDNYKELLEHEANLIVMCRQLLEQFLVKNS